VKACRQDRYASSRSHMHVKPNKATSTRSFRPAQLAEEQACSVRSNLIGCPCEKQIDAAGKAEQLRIECKLATSEACLLCTAVHSIETMLAFRSGERGEIRDTSNLIASRIGSRVVVTAGSESADYPKT
jgi:hypothetical protein